MILVPTSQALRGAILIGCAVLFLSCVQVGPKEFDIPAIDHPVAALKSCHDMAPLPPIPAVVHIAIEPGKPVQSDAGGEALLRAYAKAREARR